MDLTKYQIRALYWVAQDVEISSLQVRYKGFDFKPFAKLEKLGLISITSYGFYKVARIESKGRILVERLENLRGKYPIVDEEKTFELLVKLVKRVDNGIVGVIDNVDYTNKEVKL